VSRSRMKSERNEHGPVRRVVGETRRAIELIDCHAPLRVQCLTPLGGRARHDTTVGGGGAVSSVVSGF
jgi:hypothetical protein